jgi:YD repeat-containing protein
MYYKYATLAAMTSGGSFYTVDRDVATTGRITGERGSEGRTSLTDSSPVLTRLTTYDELGRVIERRQKNLSPAPDQGSEIITYGVRDLTTWRCRRTARDQPRHARESGPSYNRLFFDQLGRPESVRRMPGSTGYSYRVRRYDVGGRAIADGEWQSISQADCTGGANPTPCRSLQDLQPAVTSSTFAEGSNNIPAVIHWTFDEAGRPALTRRISATPTVVEESSTAYSGWWSQAVTRTFNSGGSTAVTTYERDGLDRLFKVTEPATLNATGGSMNVSDTTNYRYDHQGRLIRVQKTGGNSTGGAADVTQDRIWSTTTSAGSRTKTPPKAQTWR